MVRENIDIIVTERGSRVVKRNLEDIGKRAQGASRSLRLMQNALFVLGGVGAVRGLQRLLDTLTNYENRLRLTTTSAQNLNFVQAELFELANRSRTAFTASAEIFSRAALSLKNLGVNQREVLRLTESLNKATILSGASAREAEAGLVQFAQGLASNRLSGDELRSVLEQLPFVADVIARSLNATRGELRDLAKDGGITAEVILKAFREARKEIDERFAATIPTIEQAFKVFSNQFLEVLDTVNDFVGASDGLARALIVLSGSFDTVATAALAVGAALGAKFLTIAITNTATFIKQQSNLAKVLLNSVEIEKARATANLQNVSTTSAVTAARVRDLEVQRRQLTATLAAIETQKASEAITISNGRARSVLTGRFVKQTAAQQALNDSTKALITTQRALRSTEAQLAAARGASTTAATAEAAALGRVQAASAAASTGIARLTRAVPALAVVASTVGRIVTFLGGPLNVAIGVIVAGLFLIEGRSARIRRITQELEDDVSELALAYGEVGGNVKKLQDELTRTTLSQSLEQAEQIAGELDDQLQIVASRLGGLALRGVGQELSQQFLELSVQVRQGDADLEQIRKTLSDVGAQDEKLRPLVNEIIDLVNQGVSLEDAFNRAEAKARVLAGTATDADRALLGLGNTAGSAANSVNSLGDAAEDAAEPLRALIDLVPELAKAARVQDRLNEANKAYRRGIQELNEQQRAGEILTSDVVAGTQKLREVFRAAISEIDGTAEATRTANDEFQSYQQETDLRLLDARARAIAEERLEFEKLTEALKKAGAPQEQFDAAQQSLVNRIAAINKEFDERAKGGTRTKKDPKEVLTFNEVIAAIERETEALRLNAEQRAIANGLTQIEKDIKRGLLPEEEALARAKLASQEQTQREVDLLNKLNGPQQDLALRLSTLNSLFAQGKISIADYNEALRDIAVAATQAENTLSGGIQNGLARVAQQANEVGKTASDAVVNGFNAATDAIVNFAQRGKVNIRSFFADLFAQLLRLSLNQLFIKLAGFALGSFFGTPALSNSGNAFGASGSLFNANTGLVNLPGAAHGADFKVGGVGGTDSQLVAFKASPDERVKVTTPEQEREENKRTESRDIRTEPSPVNLKLVNVLDSGIVGDFLQTAEGERLIVNTIRRSGVLNN